MTEIDQGPGLTPLQALELELYEADLTDHLRAIRPPGPNPSVLTLSERDPDGSKAQAATEHVAKLAAVARYCAAEGITPRHIYATEGALLKFPLCLNAASILAQRDEFLAEPDTCGYAVLLAAGFGPTE